MKTPTILLVEDDQTLGYSLQAYLEMKGFAVRWAADGEAGLTYFRKQPFDLCIIDVMMPGRDGFSLAEIIQREDGHTPFIFLTARSLKVDVLKGFGLGADDYIIKPVDEEELVARIRAVLKRNAAPEPPAEVIAIGAYQFDVANRALKCGEHERRLTEREAQLLQLLCEHQGRLLSRQTVLKRLWRQSDYFTRRSMDVFISRLRKYLAADPRITIQNVYGSGFILEVEEG